MYCILNDLFYFPFFPGKIFTVHLYSWFLQLSLFVTLYLSEKLGRLIRFLLVKLGWLIRFLSEKTWLADKIFVGEAQQDKIYRRNSSGG